MYIPSNIFTQETVNYTGCDTNTRDIYTLCNINTWDKTNYKFRDTNVRDMYTTAICTQANYNLVTNKCKRCVPNVQNIHMRYGKHDQLVAQKY